MGKEWYWGAKSSKRGGQYHMDRDKSSTSFSSTGCMCAVFQLFDFHQFQFTSNLHTPHEPASRNFKPTDGSSTTEEAKIPKGVEAPRNSLKSEEGSTSLSSIIEEEEEEQEEEEEEDIQQSLNLNIPMGIQIKTSGISGSRLSSGKSPINNDFSSDTSNNSPAGSKTPSLVARLMGLDLLPDQTNSPTIHASTQKLHLSRAHTQPLRNKARHLMDGDIAAGTRSLPETPRISSARRSDVDIHHHRLSLQINRENVSDHDVNLDFSKLSALRRKQLRVEENQHDSYSSRSPGHYARQLVKQVKENVSRKVGLDITNTMTKRNRSDYNNQHELVINQLKSKRVSKALPKLEEQASRSISGKQNSSSTSSIVSATTANSFSSSCSPRLLNIRFTDSKTSTSSTTSNTTTAPFSTSPKDHQIHQVLKGKVKSNPKISTNNVQPLQDQKQQQKQQQKNVQTMNNISRNSSNHIVKGGNYSTSNGRLQKMQAETFVRRRPSTAADCRTNIPDKITKCKKTPLSNNLINLNVVPTLLPLKKSPNNSPPSTNKQQYDVFSTSPKHVHKIIPFKPTAEVPDEAQESKRSPQLSSSQSQKYDHDHHPEPSHVLHRRYNIIRNDVVHVPNGSKTRGGSDSSELRQYITRILAHTGISNTSHVSFTNWFSPSHPLDPSIFRRLEISTYININLSDGEFRLRCNRRLLFDIVDEILVDILRPYINLKPWINNTISSVNYVNTYCNDMKGSELIRTLCSRIQRFPCKDCQVLEDIDALIDEDLPGKNDQFQKEMAFEEEGEGLVTEIERDLLDTLVHEAALILVLGRD